MTLAADVILCLRDDVICRLSVCLCVCLSVSLSVSRITKKVVDDFDKNEILYMSPVIPGSRCVRAVC